MQGGEGSGIRPGGFLAAHGELQSRQAVLEEGELSSEMPSSSGTSKGLTVKKEESPRKEVSVSPEKSPIEYFKSISERVKSVRVKREAEVAPTEEREKTGATALRGEPSKASPAATEKPDVPSQRVPRDFLPKKADRFFRSTPKRCMFRYRLAELPPSDIRMQITLENMVVSKEDERLLKKYTAACSAGGRVLVQILAGETDVYNWLIQKAREIEIMHNKGGGDVYLAFQWAYRLDMACRDAEFSWRDLPLACDYSKEGVSDELFPEDQYEMDLLRLDDGIMFFPPWLEKTFQGRSLSEGYQKYWTIRQRMNWHEKSIRFTMADFMAKFQGLHTWLTVIGRASNEDFQKEGISELEVNALRYLLRQTDLYANKVKGKPTWNWTVLAETSGSPSHDISDKVSKDIEEEGLEDLEFPVKPVAKKGRKKKAKSTEAAEQAIKSIKKEEGEQVGEVKEEEVLLDPLASVLSQQFEINTPRTRKPVIRSGIDLGDLPETVFESESEPEPEAVECILTRKSSGPIPLLHMEDIRSADPNIVRLPISIPITQESDESDVEQMDVSGGGAVLPMEATPLPGFGAARKRTMSASSIHSSSEKGYEGGLSSDKAELPVESIKPPRKKRSRKQQNPTKSGTPEPKATGSEKIKTEAAPAELQEQEGNKTAAIPSQIDSGGQLGSIAAKPKKMLLEAVLVFEEEVEALLERIEDEWLQPPEGDANFHVLVPAGSSDITFPKEIQKGIETYLGIPMDAYPFDYYMNPRIERDDVPDFLVKCMQSFAGKVSAVITEERALRQSGGRKDMRKAREKVKEVRGLVSVALGLFSMLRRQAIDVQLHARKAMKLKVENQAVPQDLPQAYRDIREFVDSSLKKITAYRMALLKLEASRNIEEREESWLEFNEMQDLKSSGLLQLLKTADQWESEQMD